MKNSWLVGIVIIAAFLRFWQLGVNPPSLTWDEVAWGYNAYSLGIDGKDEFGRFLPLDYIESFGDFKPPVYAYLDVLPIKLFGLSEFAVRFPSALFGVITVLLIYFLTKRIFGQREEKLALFAAFFLAISPWHINLSRAAFEANVATFFLVSGVWLFLGGVAERRWYLVLSVLAFVLSMYTFNTARVVAPLLGLLLAVGFQRRLLERKKELLVAFLIGVVVLFPLVRFLTTPQSKLRYQEVNIFSDIGMIEKTNQEMVNDGNAWWSRILHNRRFAFTAEYLRHYFDHFKLNFLFIQGDGNPKFSTRDVGQLYLWDLPFFIAGALFLIRKRSGYWWIVPLWLLLGIVPAATARETPHALRIETTLPTFQIIVAFGVVTIMHAIVNIKMQISKIQIKYILFALCILSLIFNFLYYLHGYYSHYPREYSGEWQYGYKEAISYASEVVYNYETIVFTEALGRPYIYTLFYTKEDPSFFRETAQITREVFGFVHITGFGKYVFMKEPKNYFVENKRILYIDIPKDVPSGVTILKTFFLLNGNPVLIAYTR